MTKPLFGDVPYVVTDDADLVAGVANNPNKTTRNIFLRTYESEEVIDLWLRETHPTEWAKVYHDRDINKDGSPKKPHWHVIASWKCPASPTRYKYLLKFFGKGDLQTFVEHAISLKGATEYLWHKNNPDKFQYRKEDVISFGIDRLLETKKSEDERNNTNFIDDLRTLTHYQLGVKYGKDYIKNMRRYDDFVGSISWEEISRQLELGVTYLRENATCQARAEVIAQAITAWILTNADPTLPSFVSHLSTLLSQIGKEEW